MATQKTYQSAQDQIDSTGTEIVRRLETSLGLPDQIKNSLMKGGLSQGDVAIVAAACVSTGVDPRLMAYPNNIPPIIRMMDMMKNHGYIPGEDFYVAVYKSNVALPDETGVPSEQKTRVPTVVVMPSAARAVANMKEDGRLYGKTFHVSTKEIVGAEAKKIFEQDVPGGAYVEGKTRVVKATLKTFVAGIGALDSPGEEPVFYGFFTPYKKDKQGKAVEDWLESGKVKDNYGPVDIATKRAQTKAARYVTRTNYSRDNRPVDVRMAALVDSANNKLAALEASGELESAFAETYVDIDLPFDETPAEKRERETPARDKVAIAQPKIEIDDEGNINAELSSGEDFGAMWEVVEEQGEKKTGDTPLSPAQQIEALMKGIDNDLSDEDRGMVSKIRTSTVNPDVPTTVVANVLGICRKCGGWTPGETFAGMEKAEIAARYVIGAGPHDELKTKPFRALSGKIVEFGMKDGQEVKNLNYEEPYLTSMLFNVCDIINALTE